MQQRCKKCDQPLDEGAEFCGNCGAAVNPIRQSEPVHQTIAHPPKPAGDARLESHATASLVLGIMAIPASLVFFLGIPVSVAAFTLGLLGRHSTKGSRARIGMTLAIIAIALTILVFLRVLHGAILNQSGDPGTF